MNPLNYIFTSNNSHDRGLLSIIFGTHKQNRVSDKHQTKKELPAVPISAAYLFTTSPDYESFKKALISLNGNFAFEISDMVELGEAYFEKYPDNFNSSTAEEIHIGYRIARICLIEKIIKDIPRERKYYYRKMYYKSVEINNIVTHIINKYGKETVFDDYLLIITNLDILYLQICNIPTSMIKERYTGGISIFFNIAYLFKSAVKKYADPLM
ncbi:MAG TPA: hypothetical protein P5120_08375 [Spirochaetota bacterium]|nr:hypothetical protein [Spirochaetota bacterium]HPF06626.1 hypothetical protein [Spirochaetota bacterium]HPJ43119.1 hypothetical protein [Spirochaetota bacterium]HPR37839.1 hypothetical protein [Spirochaetota bacterium]HRX47521.1 hypothetical protein [Spirochaetota bacterium]